MGRITLLAFLFLSPWVAQMKSSIIDYTYTEHTISPSSLQDKLKNLKQFEMEEYSFPSSCYLVDQLQETSLQTTEKLALVNLEDHLSELKHLFDDMLKSSQKLEQLRMEYE